MRRIAVFRALMLGDLLCATPALRALKGAFPSAEITLVGLPWARELAARLPSVDAFEAFPGWPGLPEQACELAALPDFLARMQARRWDLLVQMHGSGGITNPLLASFGARHVACFFDTGGFVPEPELAVPWPREGHEIERLLQLTDRLGAPRLGTALDFPLCDADRTELAALWPGAYAGRPFVCLHPGAQLPSRRWPVERFAEVAEALRRRGFEVVLTGTAAEAALGARLEAALATRPHGPVVNLIGRTSLWTLGALVERARFVVCNDTGIVHVAAALGTPTVVVSAGSDVPRWAPLDARRHRVLWQATPCRPCQHHACPYEHGCATAIDPAAVIDEVRALTMAGERLHA
ncbi:glycosyltransferase family 9 protein [Caldimonas tepidiphila]|uniref:glycosyltransferase family 9 protein n=1 Tax=Caldimonas tepidiphila TaxID=2315841 RepID=UPI000E5C127B